MRKNCGATTLLRTEGDGGGDRVLWGSFFPELKENIKPYIPDKINGLPLADISIDKIKLLKTHNSIETWAAAMVDFVKEYNEVYYGLDLEWNVDESRGFT